MAEEEIFGVDVSALDADRLMNEFIRKDWLEIEVPLAHGKWFDYRFMNPVAATYLFAHEYKKVYRDAYRRNIDTMRGDYVKPLPDDLFRPKRPTAHSKAVITWIWRARQVADAMGMPYDIYLQRAYHWLTRYWRRGHLPQPSHLYTDLVTDRTAIDWDEYQRARLYYSKLPAFKNAEFDGRVKAQTDHREWLFSQASLRGNSPDILAHLIDEELLPAQTIYSRLGPEVCQRALANGSGSLSARLQ